jgi:hypothetical protein
MDVYVVNVIMEGFIYNLRYIEIWFVILKFGSLIFHILTFIYLYIYINNLTKEIIQGNHILT